MFPTIHGVVAQVLAPAGGGGGGSIQIDASTTGGGTIAASHDVTIPSGSGGLLVILIRASRSTSSAGVDAPSGWTKASSGSASFGELAVLYRVADGSEGATVTVTLNTNTGAAAWVAHRISGSVTTGTFIEATVGSYGTSNPPNLTPSWGSAENLWLAVDSTRLTVNDFTAAPTDYDGLLTAESAASSSSTVDCRIGAAKRVLTASSEDPGAFSTSGTLNGRYSATVAIRAA